MSNAAAALKRYIIRDQETGTTFEFHAMPDDGFTLSKNVNWTPTTIHGRSSPLQGYSDSSPTMFDLSIPLFSSIEAGDGRTVQDVRKAIKFFWSLAYPDYSSGMIKPPHRCTLIFGDDQFKEAMDVVCSSVQISTMAPWDVRTGLAHRAMARVTFMEVADVPWSYDQIRG